MNALAYFDHYTRGEFRPYVREVRSASALCLYELSQPAGDLSDPPVQEIAVYRTLSLLRGSFDHGSGRFRCTAKPGDFFLVPAECATKVVIDDPHAARVLTLPNGAIGRLRNDYAGGATRDLSEALSALSAGTFRSAFLDTLLPRLWRCAEEGASASRLEADLLACVVLDELLTLAADGVRPDKRSGGLAPWQERRCTEYLRENFAEDVDLPTLAAIANLSPFHFARMFKKSVGVPPHRYQVLLRLERAKGMLLSTEMSITEVALSVGYDSPQTLARLFQRELGVTPSAWRRERRR